ncbi:hypothetical protein MT418_002191 [Batrachochytrium dendrobatidis]
MFRLFTCASWLPWYRLEYLTDDILAGFTLVTMMIPQSIGYAVMANLPPIQGLYTASIPPIIYFIFGTSPYISIAPFAVTSLMAGESVLNAAKWFTDLRQFGNQSSSLPTNGTTIPPWQEYPDITCIASLQAFMLGLVLLSIYSVSLHKPLGKLVTKQLMNAFTTAASFSILTSQIKNILGVRIMATKGISPNIDTWIQLVKQAGNINWVSVVLGVVTIAMIIGLPKCEEALRQWIRKSNNKLQMASTVSIGNEIKAENDSDTNSSLAVRTKPKRRNSQESVIDNPHTRYGITPSASAHSLHPTSLSILHGTGYGTIHTTLENQASSSKILGHKPLHSLQNGLDGPLLNDSDIFSEVSLTYDAQSEMPFEPITETPDQSQRSSQNKPLPTQPLATSRAAIPAVLVAILISTLVSFLFHLPQIYKIKTIGHIQSGFPTFSLPWSFPSVYNTVSNATLSKTLFKNQPFAQIADVPQPTLSELFALVVFLLPSVFSIALVTYVTSISIICTFSNVTIIRPINPSIGNDELIIANGTNDCLHHNSAETVQPLQEQSRHSLTNSNLNPDTQQLKKGQDAQELLALSLSQLVSSFFTCFVSGAGLSRSAVLAHQTDLRTPLACLITVGIIGLIISFFTAPFQHIPAPVLSAVIVAAIWKPLKRVTGIKGLVVDALVNAKQADLDGLWHKSVRQSLLSNRSEATEYTHINEEPEQELAVANTLPCLYEGLPVQSKPLAWKQMWMNLHRYAKIAVVWEDVCVWTITLLITGLIDSTWGILSGCITVGWFRMLGKLV